MQMLKFKKYFLLFSLLILFSCRTERKIYQIKERILFGNKCTVYLDSNKNISIDLDKKNYYSLVENKYELVEFAETPDSVLVSSIIYNNEGLINKKLIASVLKDSTDYMISAEIARDKSFFYINMVTTNHDTKSYTLKILE